VYIRSKNIFFIYPQKIIYYFCFYLIIFILTNCNTNDKEEIDSETNFKDVKIKLKSVTICDANSSEKNNNLKAQPTFLFNIQLINISNYDYYFFVKNFKNSEYGCFSLEFDNNGNDSKIDLADFWSENPLCLKSRDTMRIFLTSFFSKRSIIVWNEESKEEFLKSFKIVYKPETDTIGIYDTLINKDNKFLPELIITKNEKTIIFD
jgi:hypothetical protein